MWQRLKNHLVTIISATVSSSCTIPVLFFLSSFATSMSDENPKHLHSLVWKLAGWPSQLKHSMAIDFFFWHLIDISASCWHWVLIHTKSTCVFGTLSVPQPHRDTHWCCFLQISGYNQSPVQPACLPLSTPGCAPTWGSSFLMAVVP